MSELSEGAPQSQAAALPAAVDSRVLAITPNIAVEWGYNLYVIEAQAEGSPTRAAAVKSMAELDGLLESFPKNSRERIYLNLLRMSAISFARGIFRCKGDHQEKRQAARDRKERHMNNFGRDEVFAGLRQSGFKLLLLGGLAYALARYVLGMPGMAHEPGHADYFSLATALGITLTGAFFRSLILSRKLEKLFNRFEKDISTADSDYVKAVVKEYKLAAETAALAWKQLTGTSSPTTAAFEALLLSVLAREDEQPQTQSVARPRFWWAHPRHLLKQLGGAQA